MGRIFIISAIAGILLKSELFNFFYQFNFRLIPSTYWKIQIFCSAVSSEYKREIWISQRFVSRAMVIMHSYADVIEMKRANIRNYAFVRRVIEMKRSSVKYSFAESFACIQMRTRNFVYA